jgi:hypothetical protein
VTCTGVQLAQAQSQTFMTVIYAVWCRLWLGYSYSTIPFVLVPAQVLASQPQQGLILYHTFLPQPEPQQSIPIFSTATTAEEVNPSAATHSLAYQQPDCPR